jgi:hypothetical protein
MSTTTAIQCLTQTPLRAMQSDALGTYVRNELVGIAVKLVHIKPYVQELWRRFENGETILGCTNKKQFCENVLQRSPRAVRFMLAGGNPGNERRTLELESGGEMISPQQEHSLKRVRAFGDFILAGLMMEELRCAAAEETTALSDRLTVPTHALIGLKIDARLAGFGEWNGEGELHKSWAQHFIPAGTADPCKPGCEFCRAADAEKLPEVQAEIRKEWVDGVRTEYLSPLSRRIQANYQTEYLKNR